MPTSPNIANSVIASSQVQAWAVWEDRARASVVDAMKRRKVGYKALSRELERLGIYETPGQLNRKVNRKKFPAALLLVCLAVIEGEAGSAVRPE